MGVGLAAGFEQLGSNRRASSQLDRGLDGATFGGQEWRHNGSVRSHFESCEPSDELKNIINLTARRSSRYEMNVPMYGFH